jgi:hypothetical protein
MVANSVPVMVVTFFRPDIELVDPTFFKNTKAEDTAKQGELL